MRRTIGTATTPGRWRGRRTARIALATALIVAAPFVGGRDSDSAGHTPDDPLTPNGPSEVGARASLAPGAHGDESLRVVPVPLADPGVADVLEAGDLVDLVAVDIANADPHVDGPVLVARGARVRETPDRRPGTRSILVEVPESAAAPLAATAAGTPLAVIVHG